MRPWLLLSCLVLLCVAGCATLSEMVDAFSSVMPVLADTLGNSLALSLGDAINQGAAGNPFDAEAVQNLGQAFSGAIQGGIKAGIEAGQANQGAGGVFINAMIGGITGGLAGAGGGYAAGRSGRGAPTT